MIPNYKRPRICKYLLDILERLMTDEDLDMLNYLENLEQENKKLKDNWKKLMNNLIDLFNRSQDICYLTALEKMQEIESGNNE